MPAGVRRRGGGDAGRKNTKTPKSANKSRSRASPEDDSKQQLALSKYIAIGAFVVLIGGALVLGSIRSSRRAEEETTAFEAQQTVGRNRGGPTGSLRDASASSVAHGRRPSYTVVGEIPVIDWPVGKPFTEEISARGEPVVLRGVGMETIWPAFEKWTPEYVADTLADHVLENTFAHNRRIFGPYWGDRPMGELPTITRKNANRLVNMTGPEFIEAITAERKDEFYYFANHVNYVTPLVRDMLPFSMIELDPESPTLNVNFWMGQAGTTADTHYDSYENFYVQVLGRKKWTIFPPDQAPLLYVYPFLHPSHAQCQVDIRDPEAPFPRVAEATALEFVLMPGDILYLPTNWFHSVEALDLSIAVNAWSYSAQSALMEDLVGEARVLYMRTVPSSTPRAQRGPYDFTAKEVGVAVKMYLTDLLKRIPHPPTADRPRPPFSSRPASEFAETLVATRFDALMRAGELPSHDVRATHCPTTLGAEREKALTAFIGDSAAATARVLERFPANTRDIWLGNFVELIVSNLATGGNVDDVGCYIRDCLIG